MFPALPPELIELISKADITSSFVVDSAGSTLGTSGNSSGLGNRTDLSLLRLIRAQSEVVLTSGKTARADKISMPKSADLAIFTKTGVDSLELVPRDDQQLILIGSEQAAGFPEALEFLKELGYRHIQVEFGEAGFESLRGQIELCVISGMAASGVELFLQKHGISQSAWFELEDLFVALGSGRGKA